jgi:hypothetical protein
MNSPIQNNTGRVARQLMEPAAAPRAGAEAGRLGGQEVRRAGFSWGTAGRVLAGIATVGLSEIGYAVFKACTRPAADTNRPMGGAKAHLKQSQGPVSQMSSRSAEAVSDNHSNDMPVGSVGKLYEAEHRARMDMLLGPGADYDLDDIDGLESASMGTINQSNKAKDHLISTWQNKENSDRITIKDWQADAPAPFAKDCIQRGEVAIENGKLVATLDGKITNNTDEHRLEKMNLVDSVVSMMLDEARTHPSDQVTDGEKAAFKQNLFSFTYQGNASMFLDIVAAKTKLIPMEPDALFDFSFSATDGKNVLVEQRFDVESYPVMTKDNTLVGAGPLTSKIVFSLPIDQLKRADFDPSCLTVVSADWKFEG